MKAEDAGTANDLEEEMQRVLANQPKLKGCRLVRCSTDPKALMLVFDTDLPANYWDDTPEPSYPLIGAQNRE